MTTPIKCRDGCECSAHPPEIDLRAAYSIAARHVESWSRFEHTIEALIAKFGQGLDPAGVLEEEVYDFAVHVYQSGFADGLRPEKKEGPRPPPPGKVRKGI